MANSPEQPESARPPKRNATKRDATKRDPAQHSKKDPAKPTRAKASRPDSAPTDPALAELLNPGIRQGTAGIGSGTGLQPPPDNSWERRADFSKAHTARHSTGRDSRKLRKPAMSQRLRYRPESSIPIWPNRLASSRLAASRLAARRRRRRRRRLADPARQARREPRGGGDRPRAGRACCGKGAGIHRNALGPAPAAAAGKVRGRPTAGHQIRIRSQGRPAAGHRAAGRRHQAPGPQPGAARRHRLRQDLHHGQGDRGHPASA